MKILFKYPTRGRLDLFKRNLEKWQSLLSNKYDYMFLISMDNNDPVMNTDHVKEYLNNKKNVIYCYGDNRSKVEAVNANVEFYNDWQILCLVSDDMTPQMSGYDEHIVNKMNELYPDTDGALHFNDGKVGSVLCTLSILGKKLYERFGYIYHPDYISLWADNEFTESCRRLGKITYIDQVIIKHDWTDATGTDDLHKRNENYYKLDKDAFDVRNARGFPKESLRRMFNRPPYN
jgi:hypothetical protein